MNHQQELTTESQNKAILKHLQAGLTITPLEALKRYQCFRLSARIHDLKAKGHDIRTDIILDGRKKYAIYKLKQS